MNKNKEERKPVKRRKRRKPMTDEQKLAATERLEKARAARAKKNPDYGMSGIHENLRNLEDGHFLHEGYVRRMQSYLKTGDWADTLYGEHQEHKIKYRCLSLAYEENGTPKRNIGTFYEDMGEVYTQEMFNEDRNSS